MRSALAKHLHPILGRRMVDWVVEAARPLGPDPLVVVASPETAAAFDGARRSPSRSSRSARATRSRSAREALADADEVLVLSGDTPLLTTELLARAPRHAPRDASAARPCSRSSRTTSARYGRVVRDGGRRPRARSSRRPTPTPEQLEIREANSSIYVFRGRRALAGARPARAGQRPGRALPHGRRARPRRGGQRVAVHVAPRPGRDRGGQHARRAAAAGRGAPRPRSTARTCSPGSRSSTRRRPGSSRP